VACRSEWAAGARSVATERGEPAEGRRKGEEKKEGKKERKKRKKENKKRKIEKGI
jgi:hypothetical protein